MNIPLHVIRVEAWIRNGAKYLLVKRAGDDDQAPGDWEVPGGKIDPENGSGIVEKTLRREVAEEVGIEIDNLKYFFSRTFVRSSGHGVVVLSFLADYVSGDAKPLEGQQEVQWVTLDEAKNLLDQYWSDTLYQLKKINLLQK